MTSRLAILAVAALALGAPAWADEMKGEISGSAGYTFSDGVTTNVALVAGDGNVYNRVDPKDSFSWGFTAGYFFTENWELEFLYDRQQSTLQLGGTNTRDVGNLNISNYHGVFSYHFGDSSTKARPYVFFGAGATNYGGVNYTRLNGQTGTTDGHSNFSGTFGLGVKVYPSPHAGLRLQARWTPTYIKTDSAGWWCDPYWGCYVVGNSQYSNQFEFTGGLSLRF